MTRRIALVGPGRAGGAVCLALARRGARVVAVAGRAPDAPSTRAAAERFDARAVDGASAGAGADLVVLAPPDRALAEVVRTVAPGVGPGTLVVHLSGAHGLGVLAPIAEQHPGAAVGALHPLQSLPSIEAGADRLEGAWAAVAGGPAVAAIAAELGMHPFEVTDRQRAGYHAAACVASNHLVALLGQVDRLAASAGVPREAFEPLVRASIEHAIALGPERALTGPVARGDVATVAAHLDAIPLDEHRAYRAMAEAARVLAGRDDPELVELLAVGDDG
jgi:predicted short-subunit dehydrogenase-like oxidoreductase (DUF2520 family)